jgi:hypothetical protein
VFKLLSLIDTHITKTDMKNTIKTNTADPSNVNNNIISIALSSLYPKDTIDRLISVVHATGNPYVATEMLLGVYTEPVLDNRALDQEDKINLTLISYDPFTDQVSYSYNRVNNKKGYCKRNSDNYYTEDDHVNAKGYYSSDIAKELGITSDEFNEQYVYTIYSSTVSDNLSVDTMSSFDWKEKEFEH